MLIVCRLVLVAVFSAGTLVLPALAQDETLPPVEESTADPGVADPVPEPTAAPQPVAPSPTATPRPAGPGTVLLEDNFDDPTRASLPLTSTGPGTRSLGYVDGEYEIQSGLTTPGVVGAPVPETGADTSIAVDGRVYGGPDTRGIYVLCRWSQVDGVVAAYRFGVLPAQGRFTLERQDGTRVVSLVGQPSSAIRTGEAMNRIELTCVGATITASINGTQVAAVQDITYATGRHFIGVNGAGSTGRFDNLVVTQR